MELKEKCDEYVLRNVKTIDIADYESFLQLNNNQEPVLTGLHRGLRDLLSVHAWTTSPGGHQNYLYFQMNGEQKFCATLYYSSETLCQPHTHNYIELLYVMQGELRMQIDGKTYSFKEGDICLINTNTIHCEYIERKDSFIICLCTDDIIFEQYQNSRSAKDYTLSLKRFINQKRMQELFVSFSPRNTDTHKTKHAFETIISELMEDLPGKQRIVIGYVERIIDLLAREYSIQATRSDKEELQKVLVQSICSYIEYHYDSVTVNELSQKFSYSPDYLTKIFKKEQETNLSAYIQLVRLQHASELISSTSLPIEKISRKVGYNNVGFFYKKFYEIYQTTPNEVREK